MKARFLLLLTVIFILPLLGIIFLKPSDAAVFCQCTQYVKRRFNLSSGFPDARLWDNGYLANNGFSRTNVKVGAIVVMETSFPGANTEHGHVGVVSSYDSATGKIRVTGANQGTTNLSTEYDCNNVRTNGYGTPVTGRSDISFWERSTTLVDGMTFDTHVNYPNGSQIYVNTNFTKTWRLRNTGTKTWGTGYKVAFVSGTQMNGPASVNLPSSVAPGSSIDISVNLRTPGTTGIKTGNWALQNGGGTQIGNTFPVSIDVRELPSACPGYSSGSIVLFDERDCRGVTKAFSSAGTRNLSDYSYEDKPRSIYVPSNLSLKVYEHSNKGGSSRCVTGTMYNLAVDYYTSGNTGLVLAGTISSIEVFTNNSCYTAPVSNCPTYSAPGVVPFSGYQCSGSAPYYYPGGNWWNLDTLNNNTRSLYVPSGKSVRLYEGSNRSGYTKCVNTTLYDMRADYYNATSTPLVYSDGTANLSSMEVFDNSNCSPPNNGCSGYSNSSVVLFQDSNCAGDRRYFGSGFRNLPELDFNDKASSIFIPYGMSIKVFEHDNGQGSWSCYNTVGGLWDLYQDWYQNGNTGLRLNDTPSSIQVYNNRTCS